MKTSLTLPPALHREAKLFAAKSGKGLGEVIVYWATLGRKVAATVGKEGKGNDSAFKPIDLGEPRIDINSRSALYDLLEDDPGS